MAKITSILALSFLLIHCGSSSHITQNFEKDAQLIGIWQTLKKDGEVLPYFRYKVKSLTFDQEALYSIGPNGEKQRKFSWWIEKEQGTKLLTLFVADVGRQMLYKIENDTLRIKDFGIGDSIGDKDNLLSSEETLVFFRKQ